MSFENLRELADKTVSLTDLIAEFNGEIRSIAIKKDPKTDSEVCYIKVELEDGKVLTQKLKSLHIAYLLHWCDKNAITDIGQLVDHRFRFKKTEFSIGFPRWLPVKKAFPDGGP